ncbi:MAG: c-type cytochrome [Piscinibacter sp.]|nr:c-type cytochrome [Piscinibacter sp.]
MSSSPERGLRALRAGLFAGALLGSATLAAAEPAFPGIGRAATPKEVAAWDIDVRPDFKGLPPGSGSVAQGQDVWEAKCASCHGVFGESNSVFSPLVGGTTAEDVKTGRVARLNDPGFPGRTTLMKVSTISTLWDYIHRAMPWNAPKSLSADEVYAVTAFLLNLGGVLPDNFVLSDKTMAEAQARLPNRNGTTTAHALWPGAKAGKPDVQGSACMNQCEAEPHLASILPDHARNAHGNLAEQNRLIGAQHGADTTRPPGAAPAAPAPAAAPAAPSPALALLGKHGCSACHASDSKLVGPALRDIARKHGTRDDAVTYLAGKIRSGGSGVWGEIPMPPQTLPESDARAIAQWLATGAKK